MNLPQLHHLESKISIIVPVYNIGVYIEDCIKSILLQNYPNFEAIFINDGSNDNSPEIISKYCELDDRFTLVNIENRGVTKARLEGFRYSSGDFILFLDGDDVLLVNALQSFVDSFKPSVDVVISGFNKIDESGVVYDKFVYPGSLLNKLQFRDFIFNLGFEGVPWGRMFRREVIDDSVFDIDREISLNEDALMNLLISIKVRQVKIIDFATYGYRTRSNSAISSIKNISYFINYYRYIKKICDDYNIEFSEKMKSYCFERFFHCMMRDVRSLQWNNIDNAIALNFINEGKVVFSFRNKIKLYLSKVISFFVNSLG